MRGKGEQDRPTAVGAGGGAADLRNDEWCLRVSWERDHKILCHPPEGHEKQPRFTDIWLHKRLQITCLGDAITSASSDHLRLPTFTCKFGEQRSSASPSPACVFLWEGRRQKLTTNRPGPVRTGEVKHNSLLAQTCILVSVGRLDPQNRKSPVPSCVGHTSRSG